MQNIIRSVKIFWNGSIQRQLILGIALVHAILMTIFVADLVSRQKTFLIKQNIEQTEALARSLAANSVSWVLSDDVVGLEEIVRSQKNYPNIEYAMILSPRGKVLAHTDNSLIGLYVKDKISLSLLNDKPDIRYLVNSIKLLDISVPIYSAKQHIGWSRVAISQKVLHTGLRKILRDGIGYTILAIIVGSIFAVFMARGITTGIRQLLRITDQVEHGKLDAHLENKRSDELGELGNSFNKMVGRIRQSIDDLKQSQQIALDEKEKAETYLNTAVVAFVILDLEGKIILVNPYCLKILGYKEVEIFGENWFETCVPEQGRMDRYKEYKHVLKRKGVSGLSFESSILTKNNETRIVDWRDTHLYNQQGELIGMLRSGVDITEKKQNEDELNKYRNQLEDLVTQRTGELETANNSLEREIEVRKLAKAERELLIEKLQKSLEEVKTLSGLLPICASCKKIRDDKGYWNQIEGYLQEHSEISFSHGMCPDCLEKFYGNETWYIEMKKNKAKE